MHSPPPWYGVALFYIVALIAVVMSMGHIILTL